MRKMNREIKDLNEIEHIISQADVCRLALTDDEMPYIVTMNFGYKRGNPSKIYFHCANEGKKLDMIRKNNNACFQMDIDHELIMSEKACGFSMNYKSIVGFGKVYIVDDIEEKNHGLNVLMEHYSGKNNYKFEENNFGLTTVLRLEISEMTGKKLQK